MLLPGRYFRIFFTDICQRTTISRVEKRYGLTEISANMPWIAITCPLFLDSLSFFSFFVSSPNPEPTIRPIKRFLERGKVHPKLWDFERAKYPVRPYSFNIFWPLVRYYPTYDSRDISGYFWLFVAVLPWHCNLSNAIGLANFFWGTMLCVKICIQVEKSYHQLFPCSVIQKACLQPFPYQRNKRMQINAKRGNHSARMKCSGQHTHCLFRKL